MNLVHTWSLSPDVHTAILMLFLASDPVRTNTDLATIEAARQTVNSIISSIDTSESDTPYGHVWDL